MEWLLSPKREDDVVNVDNIVLLGMSSHSSSDGSQPHPCGDLERL